ncbi:MAG: Hsp20/alpha crystallin family protein [Candidatus Bathyarchaeia archaeon]
MTDYYRDDDVFRDIDSFYRRLVERMFRDADDFQKALNDGRFRSHWQVKPIDKPGVKGYVAHGRLQLGGEPVQISRRDVEEKPEPLTDVFDERENVKIYLELPGVDKNDIQLDVTDKFVEVKAKGFAKRVELPAANVNFEKTTAAYKNGVLEVIMPKLKKAVDDDGKRTIKIE